MLLRWWGWIGLIALYVVRVDRWNWTNGELIAGIPVGLAYHVGFCFVVTFFFALVVAKSWPDDLERATSEIDAELATLKALLDARLPELNNMVEQLGVQMLGAS